jgi:hypothetical protein
MEAQEGLVIEEKPKDYRRGSITIEEVKPEEKDPPSQTLVKEEKEPKIQPKVSEPAD